jgi:hypothetical protein
MGAHLPVVLPAGGCLKVLAANRFIFTLIINKD